MANGTFTVRPREEFIGDFREIVKFCVDNKVKFNALINSLIPALAYACVNRVFVNEETGTVYLRCDFGDVPMVDGKSNQRKTEIVMNFSTKKKKK